MIIKAELINQPYSGEFNEKIYDISSTRNSQNWTWVKFTNQDLTEWCGNFRGYPRGIGLSREHNCVLILTSDYLYNIDCLDGQLIEYEEQPQYQCLTVSPSGDFIVADFYEIQIIKTSLGDRIKVDSPIKMDQIKFHSWSNHNLSITCDEFFELEQSSRIVT